MIGQVQYLGYTASGPRKIRSGHEYDRYFGKPTYQDPVINKQASVFDTLDHIYDIVQRTLNQTAAISHVLKDKSIQDTCSNIWSFCFNHIQNKLDKDGVEQLRAVEKSG